MSICVGVAGAGAIGATVCRTLIDGIDGFTLTAASDLNEEAARRLIARPDYDLAFVPLDDLSAHADWIVEALPAAAVPALVTKAMKDGKTLLAISSAALLLNPELLKLPGSQGGRLLVPSGALAGMDGVTALAEQGIKSARLVSTKAPKAFTGAPHVIKENIDLSAITERSILFRGNALQAAAAFPANVNVAATLTLASRLPPEKVEVEVIADPALTTNSHQVTVEGEYSTLNILIENRPDPANPKSSTLAALSMIAALRSETARFRVG